MSGPDSHLTVSGLAKSFGRRTLFRDLAFSLGPSSSLAVAGPNGSGKSTLLQIVAGLQVASAGEVELACRGEVVQPADRPQRVGFVAPYLNVYDDFTARENLRFIADVRRLRSTDQSIDGLLARVGLDGRQDDLVKTFSSGMKQRVRFATALLADPWLLILDEPGSNLDDRGRRLVKGIVETHTEAGGAVILATNLPGEAELCGKMLSLGPDLD